MRVYVCICMCMCVYVCGVCVYLIAYMCIHVYMNMY